MDKSLRAVLENIANEFRQEIQKDSPYYHVAKFKTISEVYEIPELATKYANEIVIIPIKESKGVGFEVDGKELTGYTQLSSGLVVKDFIAKESGFPHMEYTPAAKMYLYLR